MKSTNVTGIAPGGRKLRKGGKAAKNVKKQNRQKEQQYKKRTLTLLKKTTLTISK